MTKMNRFIAVLVVACAGIVSNDCGRAAKPVTTPAARATAAGVPLRTHENLNATLWMQTSVEYRASALQAYHTARLALDAALADPHWTAAIEQTGDASSKPPAIVLDLDETVLDNSPFEARLIAESTLEKPVPYDESVWRRWVAERKATAIPGAAEFLKYAESRHVTPIYVTNRNIKGAQADDRDSGERDTMATLRKLNIPVKPDGSTLLMKGEHGWDSSDKRSRRAFVADTYRILLLVGDNFEDFVSVTDNSLAARDVLVSKYDEWWGSKWIVLPNPTYGSWEQAIMLGAPHDDAAAALARKYAALRLAR
jgi:5'-nucleotidase (lipoprotein e(P4) family)